MVCDDLGLFVACPYRKEQSWRGSLYFLVEFLCQYPMRSPLPDLCQIYFPLIILKFLADLLDLLFDFFPIKWKLADLTIEFFIDDQLQFVFEHIEEMTNLGFIHYWRFCDFLCKCFYEYLCLFMTLNHQLVGLKSSFPLLVDDLLQLDRFIRFPELLIQSFNQNKFLLIGQNHRIEVLMDNILKLFLQDEELFFDSFLV